MSEFLESNKYQRRLFIAKLARYGQKTLSGKLVNVVILSDVRDVESGKVIATQLCFKKSQIWKGLLVGDFVNFEAAIGSYQELTKRQCQKEGALIDDEYWLASPSKVSIWVGSAS